MAPNTPTPPAMQGSGLNEKSEVPFSTELVVYCRVDDTRLETHHSLEGCMKLVTQLPNPPRSVLLHGTADESGYMVCLQLFWNLFGCTEGDRQRILCSLDSLRTNGFDVFIQDFAAEE